ncbi:hypothetical protein [Bradyrhizobium sp. Ash2021]|uniref:hypothetical protein n=1 Tax=Bradyrhizobium sp. Ash2021 TaxID=2954771 RepID=UPI0028162644|nr:hypothetical protein [Bradyrhizobium sp. Ash2021]WMT71100.1 hypothetical protein NL528_23655 [Bradyrhizobium sp. Ash2021]
MQDRWSSVAIEQHGDARVTTAYGDNDAKLVSQTWATHGSKVTHLEALADSNAICFRIHNLALQ